MFKNALIAVLVPGFTLASTAVAADATGVEELEEVVITGSRVISNGNASPTPVTIVSTEKLMDVRPSTLADTLNTLPVFAGSRQTVSNGGATGGVGQGNAVSNQLNLRNMGPIRTLILMDGLRVPPTTNGNIVDVDAIPQMMIERVDMVTGGASAVYGSDAISGVVNFITDKDLQGVKFQASYGTSRYSDDRTYNVGIAAGTSIFDDRGHIEGSYEFRDSEGVLERSSRPWYRRAVVVGNGSAAQPYKLVEDARQPTQPFGGRITCGATCSLNTQYFATDGTLSPFPAGSPVLTNGVNTGLQIGGEGGFHDASLKAPLRSHQLFGRFDYDLSDSVHAFVYASANLKENETGTTHMILNNVVLGSNNPFLLPQYRTTLSAAAPTFTLARTVTQDARLGFESGSDQYMAAAGLNGEFGDGYKWNVAYSRGDTRLDTTILNNPNNQRLAAALDATTNSAGQIVCAASLVAATAAQYANCVPLNPFGPTATSAAALDYVLQDTGYKAKTVVDDVTADVSGSPFDTWAGPATFALSAEWRQQSFSSESTAQPSETLNCAGITPGTAANTFRNCVNGGLLWPQSFAIVSPAAKQDVKEAALEADLPLLKDAALAESLSFNGAVRFTTYDTVGDYTTWKAGLSWQMVSSLRLRATESRDIRAPTLNDLYAPLTVAASTSLDLLVIPNIAPPNVSQLTYGNPDLTAEVGRTRTLGLVWQPDFLPGFSTAIDYYEINISNAILNIVGSNSAYQNACYDSGGASPYCALQVRPGGFSRTPANQSPSNQVTQWRVQPINIGEVQTHGVDLELNYAGSIGSRAFNLRGLVAWQPTIKYIQPAALTIDQGGVAFGTFGITASPSVRVALMASLQATERFRVDLQTRWRNRLEMWNEPGSNWEGDSTMDPFTQTALNFSYTLTGERVKTEVFLNVQNVFDADPPPGGPTASQTATPGSANGFATSDDVVGRYFTLGMRLRM